MSILKDNAKFTPTGSPRTRLFITYNYKCTICGARKEANELHLICNDKKQIFAVIKWRCSLKCENALKVCEYQLLSESTVERLKKKSNKYDERKKREEEEKLAQEPVPVDNTPIPTDVDIIVQ